MAGRAEAGGREEHRRGRLKMKKARLIKKESRPQVEGEREPAPQAAAPAVKRSRREMVADWLEQRSRRPDPRQAFAALFAPPRTS